MHPTQNTKYILCTQQPIPKLRHKPKLGLALDHTIHRAEHWLPRPRMLDNGSLQSHLLSMAAPVEVHLPLFVPVLLIECCHIQQRLDYVAELFHLRWGWCVTRGGGVGVSQGVGQYDEDVNGDTCVL